MKGVKPISMPVNENVLFSIADHPTPKFNDGDLSYTLNSRDYKAPEAVCEIGLDATCYRKQGHPQTSEQGQGWEQTEVNDTLNAFDSGEGRTPTVVLENHPADSRVKICKDGIVQTLSGRMGTGGNNVPMVMKDETYQNVTGTLSQGAHAGSYNGQDAYNDMLVARAVVRRLTPLECERLQGYPDGWTDIGEWVDTKGKKHKDADSAKYKALGNSIALPFWEWMAKRMVSHIDHEDITMASLFDGIGGFPLVFSRAGVKPVWASEIEEFPIAVTKVRFPDGNDEAGDMP